MKPAPSPLHEVKKTNFILASILGPLYLVGIGFVLSGTGLFGFQVYYYLKHGIWKAYSLTWLVLEIGRNFEPKINSWLIQPSNWIGMHKILIFILNLVPLSLFALISGIIIAINIPDKYIDYWNSPVGNSKRNF